MLDINKLKEWKSALDEGITMSKESWKNIKEREGFSIKKSESLYRFTYWDEETFVSTQDQNFDKFCEKVAAAIMEVQE